MSAAEARAGRSLLWPSAFSILGVALLLGLGTWQLDRGAWKEARLDERAARLAARPLETAPAEPAAALEGRRARLLGRFLHGYEFRLEGRVRGGRAGYHLVTPLVGPDGTLVLVERGWIPAAPGARVHRPRGPVLVEGVIRAPRGPGWVGPANDPARNRWFRVDPAAMARAAGLADARPYYVRISAGAEAGGLPIAPPPVPAPPNDHLGYALTWYALALALTTIYVLWRRGERR